MKLSDELAWRGFSNQTTIKDPDYLDKEPINFYFGVDPSSDSMTIGNLAAAMMVRHFIDHGHKAYLLVGGATGIIGDPDGKAEERTVKTLDEIAHNKAKIAEQYKTVFNGQDFTIVDNYDWFKDVKYIDFLREVGKNTSLTQMLSREFVQSRIGEGGAGISYAEFSYSLMQGYDFLHLFRNHGVNLQLCGADQWGNSIAGVDLIRRLEGKEAHVYSTPLVINKSTGAKFGKTEAGAIWLDEAKTSIYEFYQFWLNVDDETVEDLLKIYTLLDLETIERAIEEHRAAPGKRLLQRMLAEEVTTLVHGKDRCTSVMLVTATLWGSSPVHLLEKRDLDLLGREIPTVPTGRSVVASLVEAGLAASNGEASRLIAAGAVSLNGQRIEADQVVEKTSLIKKGKNSFALVRGN